MPTWIDTHTHLTFPQLAAELPIVLERAEAAGVKQYVIPGVNTKSVAQAIQLMRQYPGKIFACAGLHPVDEDSEPLEAALQQLESFASTPGIVAVGEIGLDTFHTPYDLEVQTHKFITQIELANSLELPVIIHTRQAFAETMKVLDRCAIEKQFVVHCYSGTVSETKEILDRGGYLSFTGLVTYPKNSYLIDTVKAVPLDRVMIETDSPFLAPQSRRGKICEPADVAEIGVFLADWYGVPVEEFAAITTQNARRFFAIKE